MPPRMRPIVPRPANASTIESISAHGLAGGFRNRYARDLRPLAAGSARRKFCLAPRAALRNPPLRPVRGLAAGPVGSRRRIGASSHLRDAAPGSCRPVLLPFDRALRLLGDFL